MAFPAPDKEARKCVRLRSLDPTPSNELVEPVDRSPLVAHDFRCDMKKTRARPRRRQIEAPGDVEPDEPKPGNGTDRGDADVQGRSARCGDGVL